MFSRGWRRNADDNGPIPDNLEESESNKSPQKIIPIPIEVSESGAPIPSAGSVGCAQATPVAVDNPAVFSSSSGGNSRDSLRKYVRSGDSSEVSDSRNPTPYPPNSSDRPISLNITGGHEDDRNVKEAEAETERADTSTAPRSSWPSARWFSLSRAPTTPTDRTDSADTTGSSAPATRPSTPIPSESNRIKSDPSSKKSKEALSEGESSEPALSGVFQEEPKNAKDVPRSWGFWSRKPVKGNTEEGEMAIYGTPTAHEPRATTVTEQASPSPGLSHRPNLVIPSIGSLRWQPSRGSRLLQMLGIRSMRPQAMLRTTPTYPRKAVVIGVHGYFPARMTRVFLGEPKGTSIKFAHEAAAAVERWANSHSVGIEVEKIALEGEGRINHRVTHLYQLLLNWRQSIEAADFVFFAVHSQGAVVTIQIIRRLVSDGLLPPSKRVVMLTMAGAFLGPMPGMDRSMVLKAIKNLEHDSLMEMFELQDPQGPLAQDLVTGLGVVLQSGVKVVLVGSADDQIVPLYSALCVHVNHPNLFRAAYLDGDDVSPQVIAPLLTLALQHRNSRLSDHGLIFELSSTLAGALTSKGHSKLYSSDGVYDLAVQVGLETVGCTNIALEVDESVTRSSLLRSQPNPYVLPWATHALLSVAESRPSDADILRALYSDFAEWEPQTKPMKELKFRLGALRSKL